MPNFSFLALIVWEENEVTDAHRSTQNYYGANFSCSVGREAQAMYVMSMVQAPAPLGNL